MRRLRRLYWGVGRKRRREGEVGKEGRMGGREGGKGGKEGGRMERCIY